MQPDFVPYLLPLEGAANTRELGGYETRSGGKVCTHRFLRGDQLSGLSAADKEALWAYGVRDIFDLRSHMESENAPEPEIDGVTFHSFPLLDGLNSGSFHGKLPGSLGELYVSLLKSSADRLCALLGEMARCSGAVLFHCTAGKDRTGIVAMLLLGLAGVPDEAIISDYAMTERLTAKKLAEQTASLKRMGLAVPEELLRSDPRNMRETLEYIVQRFGSVCAYLRWAGLSDAQEKALRARMLE